LEKLNDSLVDIVEAAPAPGHGALREHICDEFRTKRACCVSISIKKDLL